MDIQNNKEMNIVTKKRKQCEVDLSNKMTPTIYNPPNHGYCKTLYIQNSSKIGHIIGKKGSVFKAITHQTHGINYIWYNKSSKHIEIWGNNSSNIDDAIVKLHARMNSVHSKIE